MRKNSKKSAGKYTGRKRLFAEDDPRLQHAIELYKSGVSIKNIEAMTGINAKTFKRYLHRLDINEPLQEPQNCVRI